MHRIGALIRPVFGLNGESFSTPEAQIFDKGPVSVDVFVCQIIQQPAAFPNNHLQAAASSRVVFVLLEMFCQFPDAFSKNCDLDLRRTGVLLVLAKLLDRLRLRLGVQYDLFRASAIRKWELRRSAAFHPASALCF